MTDLALPTSSPVEEKPASIMEAGGGWQRPLPGLTTRTASPSIAELVEVIGEEATNRLCDVFGGISREIGKPALPIVEAIGQAAADALKHYWGAGRIYIPRRALSAKARHSMVRELADAGLTRHAIAQRMQLSERQIYNILRTRPLAAPPMVAALGELIA